MTVQPTPCRRTGPQRCRAATVGACLGIATLVAAAAPPPADAQLEERFWDCDARATQSILAPADGAQCERWQEMLKQRRFDGDFGRLLAWWRDHKAAQHARRRARHQESAAPD